MRSGIQATTGANRYVGARSLSALGGALLLALAGCGGVEPELGDNQAEGALAAESATRSRQLAAARAATAKYHDVEVALADGYVPLEGCVEVPGLGAMGTHYVNFDLLFAPLAIARPAILLYVPGDDGERLVAIEYAQMIFSGGAPYFGCGVGNETCPPEDPPPAPELYAGQPFDGPMSGHDPMMPWHYDQHVWVWAHNPAGMFAQFNPAVSCGDAAVMH